MYEVFLCEDDTGLMISESYNCGSDGCSGTDTLITDAVSETTLVAGTGWVAIAVDCGDSLYCDVGLEEGEVNFSQWILVQEWRR